jgi:hypothetical protein
VTHYVRHLLRPGDYVSTEYRCDAPEGALCRLACTRCTGEERCVCDAPDFQDTGECLVLPWLENGAPEECFGGDDGEPVRGPDWQPIDAEWNGDIYEWDYAT